MKGELQMTEKKAAPSLFNELSNEFEPSDDIILTELQIKGQSAFLFYLKTVADGDKLQQTIIRPFFEMGSEEGFASYVQSLPIQEAMPEKTQLLIKLTTGYVLLALLDKFYFLDFRFVKYNEVQDTVIEPTIHGPQLALSEDIETTINVITQRYNNTSLKVETIDLGDLSNRKVTLLYDGDRVDDKVLVQVKKKLKEFSPILFQSAADLQHFINKGKFNIFPKTIVTERPDRIVYNLVGGKVVIAIDGSPNVIIAPVIFFDFMTSMEDNYHSFGITSFIILLRYIGLFVCLLLPSVYVAMTSYSPDILRVELALTVAGGRIGVPYPSFIEVLFMLFFMELLIEASMRLPKSISGTATTVGGLILGTAATEAALVSSIMIIIISAVAISTFVIPLTEMSFAIRVIRVFLLIYTSLFGMVGLLVGVLGIILLLANMESLGTPYLKFAWMSGKKELKAGNK